MRNLVNNQDFVSASLFSSSETLASSSGDGSLSLPPPGISESGARRWPATLYARWGKRLLDIVLSIAIGVVFLPFLPLVLLAVKLDCYRAPVIVRSVRLGKGGIPFTFYRFRTRILDDTDEPCFAHGDSEAASVGPVGRFLRRTAIDEIPQLVNVLRGEMTLVGPRPSRPAEAEAYDAWERHRLAVTPGMTSLGAVSGRSRLSPDEWMRLDMQYIRTQSLTLDLKILLRTIPTVLSGEETS